MSGSVYNPDNDPIIGGGGAGSQATPAAPYNPDNDPVLGQRRSSGGYPDMTPDPANRRPSLLSTSFESLPGLKLWDDISGAPARIGTEMQQTYRDAPPLLDPSGAGQAWASRNLGWVGRNLVPPVVGAINVAGKEAQALGQGALATGAEFLGDGDPDKTRAAYQVLQSVPTLAMASGVPPLAPGLRPGGVPPGEGPPGGGPSYVGNVQPAPEGIGSTIPPGPTTPGLRPPVNIQTPADAMSVIKPQFQSVDKSVATVKPNFTDNFVKSLDDYDTSTPAGTATANAADPVADLIGRLRNMITSPIDSLASIQDVDQNIQRAISANLQNPNAVRQMRGILQDFRQRYENIGNDDVATGNPQDFQTFATARNNYAAYSRMQEVQSIIDSTQNLTGADRAAAIRNKVSGFLDDPANTRGWSPDEISQMRAATQGGTVTDFVKAGLSGLARIAGFHSIPLGLGTTAASILTDATSGGFLANYRRAQLNQAMRLLGQRVTQPGADVTLPSNTSFMRAPAPTYPQLGLLGTAITPKENGNQ